jgi:signal transduction histidine kinase
MNTGEGLALALHTVVGNAPLAIELDLSADAVPAAVEAALCSIVLQALWNVIRHAHASNVKVKVWLDDPVVVAEVEDDGVGGAHGLQRLTAAARAAGATIEIDSPPGVGTLVRTQIPLATAVRLNGLSSENWNDLSDSPAAR